MKARPGRRSLRVDRTALDPSALVEYNPSSAAQQPKPASNSKGLRIERAAPIAPSASGPKSAVPKPAPKGLRIERAVTTAPIVSAPAPAPPRASSLPGVDGDILFGARPAGASYPEEPAREDSGGLKERTGIAQSRGTRKVAKKFEQRPGADVAAGPSSTRVRSDTSRTKRGGPSGMSTC